MKLTRKQQRELEVVRYYIPDRTRWQPIEDSDIEQFFMLSDRGIEPVIEDPRSGLSSLLYGKKMRDYAVSGIRRHWGTYWFPEDFVGSPRFLVEYLAKVLGQPTILFVWREHNGSREEEEVS